MKASAADMRHWVAARRSAEVRELREQAVIAPTAAESFARAMRLVALARARHGWPLPADPLAPAEDGQAYARWVLLRSRMRSR